MANVGILLQGLREDDDHQTAVNALLSLPDMDSFVLSLAFVRRSGVNAICDELNKIAHKATFFVGIRNGVTSVQGILSLLDVGIKPFVVDTASNSKIFHPKIYAGYNANLAHVILGSANLTFGGLNRNIEASSIVKLDRTDANDEKFITDLIETILKMPTEYPDHVFQITTAKKAVKLLKESRLEDERMPRLPVTSVTKNTERDKLPPIRTAVKRKKKQHAGVSKKKIRAQANKATLVWESKPLTERSLNIPSPTNKKTNITGDMNLGKGLMEDIDFQNYFRDIVFFELAWSTVQTSRAKHLERAHISAEIVIKNYSYGIYDLEVTHNPKIDTATYGQSNAVTKIKWGEVRPLISKRDLLDRTLKLYKKDSDHFVIVID